MSHEHHTIGLIEDDPIMGESLVQRLSLEGASVTWWRTKKEALKGLDALHADVVICDIRLPDGSGEDIFRETRRRHNVVPFLFMTAFSDLDQAVRLMKAGAGDYVAKPFEMRTLLSRLTDIVPASVRGKPQFGSLRNARGEAEKTEIERVLIETGGRLGDAAKRLGVSRTTLWTRMKALGIDRKGSRRPKI
jgi:DNA-binding NtrC family response regulator